MPVGFPYAGAMAFALKSWTMIVGFGVAMAAAGTVVAQMPEPPGQVAEGMTPAVEAYLFAHMKQGDYGRLCYSVSLDGLHWTPLNDGERVSNAYRGHADVDLGPDGRYYLAGNRRDEDADIDIWVSDDLLAWDRFSKYVPELEDVVDYPAAMKRVGAPKLFFDEAEATWIVTWHTPHEMGEAGRGIPEPYWASQRTLYVTSKDLKTFDGPPRRLFRAEQWDMGTIDTIFQKVGDTYYAIIKDERYPTLDWPTGKTIRIARSDSPFGPFTEPGEPISTNFREAPTLVRSPDGEHWYLYFEQYPGRAYNLAVAASLDGPWFEVAGNQRPDWDKFSVPADARHGTMLEISRERYDALVEHFGLAENTTDADD